MTKSKGLDCFQAIADPSRRAILMMLSKERHNINTIADHFDISRPAVSKHIKVLYDAGFIEISEQGRERYCELNREGFDELQDWMAYFESYWRSQLKSLENYLNKKHPVKKKNK